MLSPLMIPPSLGSSPYRQQSPSTVPIRTGSPAVGNDKPGTLRPESPAQLSPLEGDPRDKRRMRYESINGSGNNSTSPRPGHSPQMSVPSTFMSQQSRQDSSQVHNRSLSANVGSTPLRKPLSPLSTTLSLGDPQHLLRKQPSVASSLSSSRSAYKPYDPSEALDPAYLASSSAGYVPSPNRSRSGRA